MTVIEYERVQLRRRHRRARGQMAALNYLREEIADAGFRLAADLIDLAVDAIAEELHQHSAAANRD